MGWREVDDGDDDADADDGFVGTLSKVMGLKEGFLGGMRKVGVLLSGFFW